MLNRRNFLAGAAAVLAGCRKREAFSGYAFVANQDGMAIAAVDLGAFECPVAAIFSPPCSLPSLL